MKKKTGGFTLVEFLIITIVGGILIATTAMVYSKVMVIYRRQQRVILLERELTAIQQSFAQALTTLPGRDLGYFSGVNFSVGTELPSIGIINTDKGPKPIKLGIVTPFKVAGNDAMTLIYARRNVDRLELVQASQELPNGEGIALAIAPDILVGQPPIPGRGGRGKVVRRIRSHSL